MVLNTHNFGIFWGYFPAAWGLCAALQQVAPPWRQFHSHKQLQHTRLARCVLSPSLASVIARKYFLAFACHIIIAGCACDNNRTH